MAAKLPKDTCWAVWNTDGIGREDKAKTAKAGGTVGIAGHWRRLEADGNDRVQRIFRHG